MNEYVEVIETGVIRIQRLLPGPIDRVWAHLTESEKRGKWLATGEMELKVGGKVIHDFQHGNLSEEPDPIPERYCNMEGGTSMEGTVTQIDPPRLLAYTWGETDGDSTEVIIELSEQDDQVLLTLTHRQLPDHELVSVASGWHTHLDILVKHLSGQFIPAFWKTHMTLEKEYEKRLR